MIISESNLRDVVAGIIVESTGMHRCLDGRIVDSGSEECFFDIEDRIDDAIYQRNQCPRGSANRSHYNGLLSDLRMKRGRLRKKFPHLNEAADRSAALDALRNAYDESNLELEDRET